MANTYTQLYIHLVFAVQGRMSLIRRSWKNNLEQYITGIIQKHRHKLIIINSQPDHIHLLIGMEPSQALSDLVREIKASSSKHVNDERWSMGRFQWQEGYGAFSVCRSILPQTIQYVQNQAQHHGAISFLSEFRQLLNRYDVTYDEAYLFRDADTQSMDMAPEA